MIAGSIGGVVLVILLIAGYCYCFPAGFVKKNRRRAESRPLDEGEQLKNGNGAMPLVNGGSLVVTSASRGSVLLNIGHEGGNDAANESLDMRNRSSGNHNEDLENSNDRESQEKNDEFPQALEPRLRSVGNEEDEISKTLSMSIPDVTRVEPQVGPSVSSHVTPQPQFFTLGRGVTRNNSNSSSASSRHSFHDRAGPSSLSPHLDKQMMNQFLPTSQVQDTGKPNQDAIGTGNGSSGNIYNMYRNLDQINNGEVGSLYRDGSIGGDSLSEGLLCDDRTASPPPPAPSGPSDRQRASPYTPLNRRSLAML